jgi:hypothetical protein
MIFELDCDFRSTGDGNFRSCGTLTGRSREPGDAAKVQLRDAPMDIESR